MSDVKAFNRWGTEGITVTDMGLKEYIVIEPRIVPHSAGRYAGKRFWKSKSFIVERLINKVLVPGHKSKKHFLTSGHNTGKTTKAYQLVEDAFKLVEQKAKKNPLEVFVKAVENAAPREEIITIEYGGARYPKAVECSPQRRVDIALRQMVQGSYQRSFGTKKKSSETLADEILAAYNNSANSVAIAKKNELERQADSSR